MRFLNGYKWAETKGAFFGANGQPEASYSLILPPDVPDGVIDIVVRAQDDLEVATDSAPITVTKGTPCATADTCAEGQLCEAGRCFWAPPVGELGEECTFTQFCKGELCQSLDSGESRCTQNCVLGIEDSCPPNFQCLANGDNTGVCWPASRFRRQLPRLQQLARGLDPGRVCSCSASASSCSAAVVVRRGL